METTSVEVAPARVLILPGNDLGSGFYRPFAEALASHQLGVSFGTLPGFAGTPALAEASWEGVVEHVLAQRPRPGVLVGHSLGGLVALLCAARRPKGLTHLVLLEPAVFASRLIAKLAARRYVAEVIRGDRDHFSNHNGLSRRAHRPECYPREMIEHYLEQRKRSDPRAAEILFARLPELYPLPYDRVEVPVLLVSGAEIGPIARAMRLPLLRHLRPRHEVLKDAAHWLVNERDEELARIVASFLR